MKKFSGLMTSLSPHWATPKWLYDKLNQEFNFDYDPCPLNSNFDGLNADWGKSNFINPPYGREVGKWIKKSFENKNLCVMLLPARTDTKWFHYYVLKSSEIRWIKGRLKFGNAKNLAPFPSMIVIFNSRRKG